MIISRNLLKNRLSLLRVRTLLSLAHYHRQHQEDLKEIKSQNEVLRGLSEDLKKTNESLKEK